jgi:hypothetical protein
MNNVFGNLRENLSRPKYSYVTCDESDDRVAYQKYPQQTQSCKILYIGFFGIVVASLLMLSFLYGIRMGSTQARSEGFVPFSKSSTTFLPAV